MQLPSHWMVPFFLIRVHLELIQNEEAIELLSALQRSGFGKCNEVLAQLAVANHNLRGIIFLLVPYEGIIFNLINIV